mgnify:CR=1 FL=1
MSYLSDLITRRNNVAAQLAAITTGSAGHGPSYSIPEESIPHDEHVKRLLFELSELNNLINVAEGPWEVRSVGFV